MSKRTTSDLESVSSKKIKLDDLKDFWDNDFDCNSPDRCFKETTQEINKNFTDIKLTASYATFKGNKNVLTSTQMSTATFDEINGEENIKELKEKYAQKEGEVSILRSNLQNLRTSYFIDKEKKQNEWKEKIETVEKENKYLKSTLEFKDLEIVNLKQRMTELSRVTAVADPCCTQKTKVIQGEMLHNSTKLSTPTPKSDSRVFVNIEKHNLIKTFLALLKSEGTKYQLENLTKFQKCDKEDMILLYDDLIRLVTKSTKGLGTDLIIQDVDKVFQFFWFMMTDLNNFVTNIKVKIQNGEIFDIQGPQNNSLKEKIDTCCKVFEFFGELIYDIHMNNYFLAQELLLLATTSKSNMKEESRASNILSLLSQILLNLGTLEPRYSSLFFESAVKFLCKMLYLTGTLSLSYIQNIQHITDVFFTKYSLKHQMIFFDICSRNHSFIRLLCSGDTNGICKFYTFANLLEEKLLKKEEAQLLIHIGQNILNIVYNISRKDYLLIQQQNDKPCGCISKLFKLAVFIIYEMLNIYNIRCFKQQLLDKHSKIFIFLMFNAFDFIQESILDHAMLREIVYILTHSNLQTDNLKDLQKLVAKEEYPAVSREKFMSVSL